MNGLAMSLPTDRTEYLFSYGTLRLEPVQIATFGRKLDGAPDRLPGHRLVARPRSSVGLRWPSKRIAALHRLPIRSVWAAQCSLRCAPMAARSLRHLIRDATLGAGGGLGSAVKCSADVLEQRQSLHLGVGLERRLVAHLLVLEVRDALDHVQVLGPGAVAFELYRAPGLVARDAVGAVEQFAGIAAHVVHPLQPEVDIGQRLP